MELNLVPSTKQISERIQGKRFYPFLLVKYNSFFFPINCF
jgi:hypothetical protein